MADYRPEAARHPGGSCHPGGYRPALVLDLESSSTPEAMKRLVSLILRPASLLALIAALAVAPATVAQDTPADRHARHVERLAETLDLSDAQRAAVTDAMGEEHTPSALWNVAAALAPTLTDAQKERLFTRPERAERPRAERARRDSTARPRGERMKRERPNRAERAERMDAYRDEMHAAMRTALN